MTKLGFYKLDKDVPVPKIMTEQSACFDICYWPRLEHEREGVKFYTPNNTDENRYLGVDRNAIIMPGDRMILPTSLILDIPNDHSVRVHPRSSVAIKRGLALANCEAVIDADYVDELFIVLMNISNSRVMVRPGDRIAQAELVPVLKYDMGVVKKKPTQKTDRSGGLGSTGE